jgi:hypothetical protein
MEAQLACIVACDLDLDRFDTKGQVIEPVSLPAGLAAFVDNRQVEWHYKPPLLWLSLARDRQIPGILDQNMLFQWGSGDPL